MRRIIRRVEAYLGYDHLRFFLGRFEPILVDFRSFSFDWSKTGFNLAIFENLTKNEESTYFCNCTDLQFSLGDEPG